MRVTGKYDGWECETFVMQLSADDLNKLHLLLEKLPSEPIRRDDAKKRFLDMLSETEKPEFGTDYYVTKEY